MNDTDEFGHEFMIQNMAKLKKFFAQNKQELESDFISAFSRFPGIKFDPKIHVNLANNF